jgi:bacterioferritin-associated ferredoxin
MYVCQCRAVTDRAVRAAIDRGARTIEDLARCSSAGSRCGGCWPALAELLEAENPRALVSAALPSTP